MELLEQLNTLMVAEHMGNMHGNLLQQIFFFDNIFCAVFGCIAWIYLIVKGIHYLYRKIRNRNLYMRAYGRNYRDFDPDRA